MRSTGRSVGNYLPFVGVIPCSITGSFYSVCSVANKRNLSVGTNSSSEYRISICNLASQSLGRDPERQFQDSIRQVRNVNCP